MVLVKMERSGSGDPFRCYVGRMVPVEHRPHVVERYEVDERRVLFRLRPVGPGPTLRVTVLELLDLLEKRGA